MADQPPRLVAPPPHADDHPSQPYLPPQDYSDIFSFGAPLMPNGTEAPSFGADGPPSDIPTPSLNPAPHAQATAGAPEQPNGESAQDAGPEHAEDSSDAEDDDSEDGGGEAGEADGSWYPIFEEKREPVEDELRFWKSTNEPNALDHKHWEDLAFTDLKDPQLTPGASGRIEFSIDSFNGTKEKPNKETVMRSEVVNVGGYDWRVKLYPKGNNTDHLSVYVENVTLQSAGCSGSDEFAGPPLPFLVNSKGRPSKRRCVAAQLCVAIYNPTEPRQFEHQVDCHQFSKESPDYGWTRFTQMRRRDLGLRNHFQRAPLLQDDKLALRAYIRVIDDPTGCLWDHSANRYDGAVSATGLRPFSQILPILAADLVLLHFAPFRELVQSWHPGKDSPRFVSWMQIMLWKMLARERSDMYGEPSDCEQSDAVAWLQRAVKGLREQEGSGKAEELLGTMDGANGAATNGNRLKTQRYPSVQAAMDAQATAPETPALLTLELERQHYDQEKRKWKRVTNKVDVQDVVQVGGKGYKLFAFVTHCGELSSNRFSTYIRPRGPGTMWYAYTDNKITCMTHKQALKKRRGRDEPEKEKEKHDRTMFSFGRDRRGMQVYRENLEVAHVVFYVRDDYAEAAFSTPKEIDWTLPTKDGSGGENLDKLQNGSSILEKEVPQDQDAKEPSTLSNDSGYIAGCATPTHWFMDEDGDVVMSDDEDGAQAHEKDERADSGIELPEAELVHRTIDNLGCSYYSGQMLGSKHHGEGHLITLNGDEYTGQFSHGLKQGTGKMIYSDTGDIYEGEWADNQRHGRGEYIEASTGNVFDGTWKQGKKSGQFTLTGTVTDEDKGICGICYEREMDTAFYDCGHVVACNTCAQQIEDCPVCRRRIVSRLQLFGVKVSLE